MPRPVVPILPTPAAASRARSSALWYGRMQCAESLIEEVLLDRRRPRLAQVVDLLEQRGRVDDHAVAEEAELVADG